MIKFLDLQNINKAFEPELSQACTQVINSGWYIQGKQVCLFEDSISQYCQSKHAIGVGSGLDALSLVLKAWLYLGKISIGDEVLIPANTFIATALAATNNQLKIVLVEPEPDTFNISAKTLLKAITTNAKVIIPVHLYGQLAPMKEIMKFSQEHNLLVLEDSAQAIGAQSSQGKSGALAHAAAFSFYPGKNLGALGDGGMITTNDDTLAKQIRVIANYGASEKYQHEIIGVNSRLDEVQAAILNVKLPYLDKDNQKRRVIAQRYLSEITNDKIILPKVNEEKSHVWHLFVIRTERRDELQQHLKKHKIETLIHYPVAIHQQAAYQQLAHLSLPCTEKLQKTILSLPIYPTLNYKEQDTIISAINSFQ